MATGVCVRCVALRRQHGGVSGDIATEDSRLADSWTRTPRCHGVDGVAASTRLEPNGLCVVVFPELCVTLCRLCSVLPCLAVSLCFL